MAKKAKLSSRGNEKNSKESPQTKRNSLSKTKKIRQPIKKKKIKKKQCILKTIGKNRKVTYVKGPEGEVNIQITRITGNINTNNNVKANDILLADSIHSSEENPTTAVNKRTISNVHKTIERAENDTNNDVIIINDCDDSEVIFVGEYPPQKYIESGTCNDSVILIDDDSISEASQTHPVVNNKDSKSNCDGNNSINKQFTAINCNGIYCSEQFTEINCVKPLPKNKLVGAPPALPMVPADIPQENTNKESKKKKKNERKEQQTQNIPSPILSNSNLQGQKGKALEIATSTPIKAQNLSQFIPQVICNLANLQVCQPMLPVVPTPFAIKADIINEQIKQIRRSVSMNNFNSFGSNFLNAGPVRTNGLRPIFIDGSNVALGHSNGKYFSVEGLKICIDYFRIRSHEVTAIVPMFRKKFTQSSNPRLLQQLEQEGTVVFTPSRTVNGRHIVPYDDRYIVLLAHVYQGVIVSSDNYQDLLAENPSLVGTIENRILNPTWLKDMIIFPSDPMGRNGPKLDEFLRFPEENIYVPREYEEMMYLNNFHVFQ